MRVSQQKVYSVRIKVSDDDLAQGRPGPRSYICYLLEEGISIAEILFHCTDDILSEGMSGYYLASELLVP